MERTLAEQLQDVIDALLVAEAKAQVATQTIRKQRLYLGLGLNHPDVEIMRLISILRYSKLVAENKARAATAQEPDRSPAQEVDGRLASLSDAGDTLVAHPLQDATALSDIGSEAVEGAVTESALIPPVDPQPPSVDDTPVVPPVTTDETGESPPVDAVTGET